MDEHHLQQMMFELQHLCLRIVIRRLLKIIKSERAGTKIAVLQLQLFVPLFKTMFITEGQFQGSLWKLNFKKYLIQILLCKQISKIIYENWFVTKL